MDIQFVAQIDASADVVAFPVRTGGLSAVAGAQAPLLMAAALQKRFDGAAGAIAEPTVFAGRRAQRLLRLGIGQGGEHAPARGGAALTARLQTLGVHTAPLQFRNTAQNP